MDEALLEKISVSAFEGKFVIMNDRAAHLSASGLRVSGVL
jgi:hypothetical protein